MPPARLPMNSRYDDVWSGGWDELFPNDEATSLDGEAYPDHGEVWTSPWQAERFANRDEVGVHLRLAAPQRDSSGKDHPPATRYFPHRVPAHLEQPRFCAVSLPVETSSGARGDFVLRPNKEVP